MKTVLNTALALLVWIAAQTCAADANELTARQSISINAPPGAVWAVVGDFNGQPRWLPLVERSEIVVGSNNQIGAIRLVTRRNGTKVSERLLDYDPYSMRLAYTYVDGAVMASDYFPVVTVAPAKDGTCDVEWSAHFKRLDYWIDPPPEGQDDKSLVERYNGLYRSGLENLKRIVEGAH